MPADRRTAEGTPEHPFWVEGKGFIEAKRLARSDLLRDASDKGVRVEGVSKKPGKVRVYNFKVEGTHTYYAAGLWVHNANCTPGQLLSGPAEAAWREWLEGQGIDLEPKGGVYGPGPDAVRRPGGADPGWSFAELKRANKNGINQGRGQVRGRLADGLEGPGGLYLWQHHPTSGFSFRLYKIYP